MKKIFLTPLLIIAFASTTSLALPVQPPSDSSRLNNDSLVLNTSPFQLKRTARSYNTITFSNRDPQQFHLYSGTSVLNLLRGHVPGHNLPANLSFATSAGIRGRSTLVLDGIPFDNQIGAYTNMNAFEYAEVTAVTTPNATIPFGATPLGGGLFLRSKTGEGYDRPAVEANSATILHTPRKSNSDNPFFGRPEDTWLFSNSVAYMQDFGPADVRVSYNYQSETPGNEQVLKNRSNYLRVNAGTHYHDIFYARLIVDYGRQNVAASFVSPFTGAREDSNSENILQGNLLLQAKILPWLRLTSQHSLQELERDITTATNLSYFENISENRRYFGNIFARFDIPLRGKTRLSAYAGVQKDDNTTVRTLYLSSDQFPAQKQEYNVPTAAVASGLVFNLDEYLFADLDLRRTFSDVDNRARDFAGGGLGFVFSRFFKLENKTFSSGKIRINTSRADGGHYLPFPWFVSQNAQLPYQDNFTTLEAGTDIGLFRNRVTISGTWYKNREIFLGMVPIPTSSGFTFRQERAGDLFVGGFDIIASAIPFNRRDLRLESKLIWSRYTTEIDLYTQPAGGNNFPTVPGTSMGNIFFGAPVMDQSGNSILLNTTPQWTGSLLNQLTWKKLFLNALLDVRKGGQFYDWQTRSIESGSRARIRDLSVGVSILDPKDSKFVRNLIFSVSARNIITLYQSSDTDVEETENSSGSTIRSFAGSVTIGF